MRLRSALALVLLFAAMTAAATWPQPVRMRGVPDHPDAYFSLWRLGWIAHQLAVNPARLFDGNIYYPERNTLAYSDAILLPGAIAAPFIFAGVPIVILYNVLILASFLAAALGMCLLARHLFGSWPAGILAGTVFAFASYRFDHYMHLELLWAHWMPLTLWALHRTIETGRLVPAFATAVLFTFQALSSVYYGVFLGTTLVIASPVMLLMTDAALRRRAVFSLAIAAIVPAAVLGIYVRPYAAVREVLGERKPGEAMLYAAGPTHYVAAVPDSIIYGNATANRGRHEKRLFPGGIAISLGLYALLPPFRRTPWLYAVLLAIAVDGSFGPRGILFGWLRDHLFLFRGLRVPARFGHVALAGFAVLAAAGCVRLERALRVGNGRLAHLAVPALIALAFIEYLTWPRTLVAVATEPPEVYRWLRAQPPGVIAELPMPTERTLPLNEAEFSYLSTFHWRPMVNGYSGNYPDSYMRVVRAVERFPDATALAALSNAGVTYIIVHERLMGPDRYGIVVDELRGRDGVEAFGPFEEQGFEARAYRLAPGVRQER